MTRSRKKTATRKKAVAIDPIDPLKLGRPTTFTQDIADVICRRLADGESLRKICDEEGMPDRHTVRDWRGRNEAFDAQYARAREDQADSLADECLSIADSAKDKDSAAAARVQVDTRKWYAGKLRPKVYGERSAIEMSGKNGAPLFPVVHVIFSDADSSSD